MHVSSEKLQNGFKAGYLCLVKTNLTMNRTIIISVMLATMQTAMAQMTLNDCLIYARDHAHKNIINNLATDKARIDSRISASALMPSIGLSADGNISFGRNIDPETNTYDNKKTLYTGFGLNMSIPLFDGLVSINNLKAARTRRRRMEKSAEAEADIVSIEVIKSFYNVSFCKAMVAQIEEQLARDRKTMMATERGKQLGAKSGADVAEIRAILANDEYELTNQRNLLAKAYLQLRGAMGMEISTEPLDLVETEYEAEPVAGFIHPRLEEALMAVKESRYNLRAAKGAFSPRISLSAGASTSYYKMIGDHFPAPGFSRQLRDNMGQYIGLSVSIPLFTGLATANKVKRAGIELATCRTQLEQTRYDIERQKTEARLDYRASAEEFVSAQARLDAEQLAYNAIRRKFELGSASAIDLYTSGAKLASARAALEGKRINRIICRITLGYYLGEKLIHEK